MAYDPNKLAHVHEADRGRYIDAKINARVGLCAEPIHPLDQIRVPEKRIGGANHLYKLGLLKRSDYEARKLSR